MSVRRSTLVATGLAAALAGVLLVAPGGPEGSECADQDQRPGLVSQALMFEDTNTHYPTGAEFAQAVYASQCITISSDIAADSYVSNTGAMPGDIVDGYGYVGIMVDDTTAIGVADDGGPAQIMRLTTEDVRRVDW